MHFRKQNVFMGMILQIVAILNIYNVNENSKFIIFSF